MSLRVHLDLGNQFHHFRVGGPARYGAVLELRTPPADKN
jgi:hypothetical protein